MRYLPVLITGTMMDLFQVLQNNQYIRLLDHTSVHHPSVFKGFIEGKPCPLTNTYHRCYFANYLDEN